MSKVAIAGNASGTGVFTIAAPNSNSDRTLTLPDEAGTVLTSASDITSQAQSEVIAFQVYGAVNVSITSAGTAYLLTFTKPGNANDFDTHNYYDTSTNRYVPQTAGYYFFSATAVLNNIGGGYVQISIRKNGTAVRSNRSWSNSNDYFGVDVSCMAYCNGSTDYIDVTIETQSDTAATVHDGGVRNFCGYLVRAA